MSVISSTTGHSARGERNIARILYVCIAVAVIVGMVIFFVAGQKNSLHPMKSDDAMKDAPAASQPAAPTAPAR